MSNRPDLRILLLEVRHDPAMIEHERSCLLRAGKLRAEQVVPYNLLREPCDPSILRGYHAVVIGGTGDYSVAKDRPPFFQPLVDLTNHLLEVGMPALGLCYGHHLMAHAVGGDVQTRPDMGETGTFEMELTAHGRQDAILGHLPDRFLAQQGHNDAVLDLPEGFQTLAVSQRCPCQALRHLTRPFYGLQFHPELHREDLLRRMLAYADQYAPTPEKRKEIDEMVRETTIDDVIERFIDRVVVPWTRTRATDPGSS